MEYIDCILVNNIIQDFKEVTIPVAADEQVFAAIYLIKLKHFIIPDPIKRHANIGLRNTMFERRLVKLDDKQQFKVSRKSPRITPIFTDFRYANPWQSV